VGNELGAIRFQSVRFRTATAAIWARPARLLDSQIVHSALRPRHLMAVRDVRGCVVARTTSVAHIELLKCASWWRS